MDLNTAGFFVGVLSLGTGVGGICVSLRTLAKARTINERMDSFINERASRKIISESRTKLTEALKFLKADDIINRSSGITDVQIELAKLASLIPALPDKQTALIRDLQEYFGKSAPECFQFSDISYKYAALLGDLAIKEGIDNERYGK